MDDRGKFRLDVGWEERDGAVGKGEGQSDWPDASEARRGSEIGKRGLRSVLMWLTISFASVVEPMWVYSTL